MLYHGTGPLKGKFWQLPNGYWRAVNYMGKQTTCKLQTEAQKFAAKGKPLNEATIAEGEQVLTEDTEWEYQDNAGRTHRGVVQNFYDHGGTDVTYVMVDKKTGERTVLSGSRLKSAKVVREQRNPFHTYNDLGLSSVEMHELIDRLRRAGFRASAKGNALVTDAPEGDVVDATMDEQGISFPGSAPGTIPAEYPNRAQKVRQMRKKLDKEKKGVNEATPKIDIRTMGSGVVGKPGIQTYEYGKRKAIILGDMPDGGCKVRLSSPSVHRDVDATSREDAKQIARKWVVNEATLNNMRVRAKGVFAKGLKDGEVYTLRQSINFQGEPTYQFVPQGSNKAVARYPESDINRFLHNGNAGANNGLVNEAYDVAGWRKKLKDVLPDADKLEIYVGKSWSKVDPLVFRSFTGPRRRNGQLYKGPRYTWLTNNPISKGQATQDNPEESVDRTNSGNESPAVWGKTDSYALVVGSKVVARGNKKKMHSLRKKTPGSQVWLTTAPIGSSIAHGAANNTVNPEEAFSPSADLKKMPATKGALKKGMSPSQALKALPAKKTIKEAFDTSKMIGGIRVKTKRELNYSKTNPPVRIPAGTTLELKFNKLDPRFAFINYNGDWKPLLLHNCINTVTGINKPPSQSHLEKMNMDGYCTTVTGKRVEPDGYGPDGSPSWLLALGMI